jgi:hypothetical protein
VTDIVPASGPYQSNSRGMAVGAAKAEAIDRGDSARGSWGTGTDSNTVLPAARPPLPENMGGAG